LRLDVVGSGTARTRDGVRRAPEEIFDLVMSREGRIDRDPSH
jgi:hypothetical protein